MPEPPIYFPEPPERDDSWGRDDELQADWLRRSTLPRARSLREALNENLAHFPPEHAKGLAKKLRADWKSHYFELLVGRWLQSRHHQGARGTEDLIAALAPATARLVEGEASRDVPASAVREGMVDWVRRTGGLPTQRIEPATPAAEPDDRPDGEGETPRVAASLFSGSPEADARGRAFDDSTNNEDEFATANRRG